MPLPKIPNDLPRNLLRRLLTDFRTVAELLGKTSLMEGGRPARVSLEFTHHPLYLLDYKQISKFGESLPTPKHIGWRILTTMQGSVVALEYRKTGKGGRLDLHSIREGGYIDTLPAQMEAAHKLGDFHLGELEIMGMGSISFQLQAKADPNSVSYYPLTPGTHIQVGQLHSAAEFKTAVEHTSAAQGAPVPTPPFVLDLNTTYWMTNMFLAEGVGLHGVGSLQRPEMRSLNVDDPMQWWRFLDLGNGYFRIICLGIAGNFALEGGAKDSGALMNGTANQSGQMWHCTEVQSGYVKLTNMFAEADNYEFEGGALNGGALIMPGGHSGQAWKLIPAKRAGIVSVSKATWFNGAIQADVTAKVQQFADAGLTSFEARNHILGADPAPGMQKTLTVEYLKDNVAMNKSVTERQYFIF